MGSPWRVKWAMWSSSWSTEKNQAGAESTKLISGSGIAPSGFGSVGLNFHKR
ncbi:hypothetical protein JHK84_028748 [Glycine max]|nr:hypothetical protein JHK85_029165 [Glycine max]KAG5152276.1 hypothetical protein JHK84_028748 [Glycine max]